MACRDTRDAEEEVLISPRALARRWDCTRTTAQRIAERAKIPKVFLGEGKNGTVRYPIDAVKRYEASRTVASS